MSDYVVPEQAVERGEQALRAVGSTAPYADTRCVLRAVLPAHDRALLLALADVIEVVAKKYDSPDEFDYRSGILTASDTLRRKADEITETPQGAASGVPTSDGSTTAARTGGHGTEPSVRPGADEIGGAE